MNIVIASRTDWAGAGFHLANAVNSCTDHHMVQVSEKRHRFGFPVMYLESDESTKHIVENKIKNADVYIYGASNLLYHPYRQIPGKDCKLGVWHQGTDYRTQYNIYNRFHRDLDYVFAHWGLMGLDPRCIELPVPIDVMNILYNVPHNEVPIIDHAPSISSRKGTDRYKIAVDELEREGYKLGVHCQMNQNHSSVMLSKRWADIYFDQILSVDIPYADGAKHGYGVGLCEAMASGCACLDGCEKEDMPHYKVKTEQDIYDVLKFLLENPNEIERNAVLNRKWVESNVNYPVVAKQFISAMEG